MFGLGWLEIIGYIGSFLVAVSLMMIQTTLILFQAQL